MSVVSYRLYCDHCSAQTIVKERKVDETEWSVNSLISHSGVCPDCSELPTDAESDSAATELSLEELDNIGETAAQNLREAGYTTTEDIAQASDEDILDVSWVGQKGLDSLKEAAKELEPQKRWE